MNSKFKLELIKNSVTGYLMKLVVVIVLVIMLVVMVVILVRIGRGEPYQNIFFCLGVRPLISEYSEDKLKNSYHMAAYRKTSTHDALVTKTSTTNCNS